MLKVIDEDGKESTDPAKVAVIALPDIPTYPDDPVTPPVDLVSTGDGAKLIDDFVRFELTKLSGMLSEEARIQLIGMADQIYELIERGSYSEAQSLATQAQSLASSSIQDPDMRDAISGSFGEVAKFLDYPGSGQMTAYAVIQVSQEGDATTITIILKLHYVYEGENIIIETTITFTNTLIIRTVTL